VTGVEHAGVEAAGTPVGGDRPAGGACTWGEAEDAILGGDLTAALGYVTPARGVVLAPVAPIGLRDRAAGTVGFTTSVGFGRKLERIDRNPRVALAYHAREHGFAAEPRFVLVQGVAGYDRAPSAEVLSQVVRPASTRFLGAPKTGPFWDRWLKAYYADRVLVTVHVERVVSWPPLEAAGRPTVFGPPLPAHPPAPQREPTGGVAPRVDVERAARRIGRLSHVLAGYLGADGLPLIVPTSVSGVEPGGLGLSGELLPGGLGSSGELPPGGRRAGLLAHRYEPRLIGLELRQYTGWLVDGLFAPFTEKGFRAPANKTLLLLVNGAMARRGARSARSGSG
jgi:hypothetical protein